MPILQEGVCNSMNLRLKAWYNNKMWGPIGVLHMDFPGWISDFPPDVELMVSTGLKDIQGVEIYEGDILKKSKSLPHEPWIFVKWDINMWTIPRITNGYEIIGNVYENPELLKEEL